MPAIPRITGRDAVRAFERAGFTVARISGSHHILKKEGCPNRLSIPVHAGETVGTGLLKSQIEAAGLTIEQFLELL
ncbi:MAG: type II toxin-antitoxin system HicA family toxin [Planctomycetes bacterium]|nr:type II toxin-antitoxin system HicA family toxin [Planctomycetia bacterium]MBI3464089.1 type II toxin-antitoxin system HicA family toxin [Planctomycetota bacterium]